MSAALVLLLFVLLIVLAFEYINGFHDTANAIATVVSTKVLTPRQALALAAIMNLIGAFFGSEVAKTMISGIVDGKLVDVSVVFILCTMLSAITWNLLTWWFGMPSSSSHALIGSMCGTALAASHMNWHTLIWSRVKIDAKTGAHSMEGIFHKVVIPMISSPVLGILIGFLLMGLIFFLIRHWRPHTVNTVFGRLQILSAGYMGWGHGLADAQKTMGVITLMLLGATKAGTLNDAPAWLGFLKVNSEAIPAWVKLVCAFTMAAGTWAGGWKIIKTLGHKMVKMKPVHGFAAETTAASILFATGAMGMPVSTTHVITTSIMGVGAAKRWGSVKWTLVERIVWAWIFTIPVTAVLAFGFFKLGALF
ncbi:MAG: inorganic phosphate transporter [Verrucomicrobiaceae bacterium]|nr:inorganic phosphate transporter [Verrucomicrobiaceae bacterium]